MRASVYSVEDIDAFGLHKRGNPRKQIYVIRRYVPVGIGNVIDETTVVGLPEARYAAENWATHSAGVVVLDADRHPVAQFGRIPEED